jgi:glycosyltransferase involved in cell wall biosynthesis
VAVVVPSHRAENVIGACLDGLAVQSYAEPFEVHVVDTGADGTEGVVADHATNWNGRLRYHRAERRGPGRQRNQGAKRSGAELLAFTDADCVPEPGWLAAGVERLREGASIVQGPVRTPDGSPPPAFSHAITIEGPSPLYESCNVFYEARAFHESGGFSVDLFDRTGSHMGEDTELGWRVRRNGGRVVYDERALVRHAVHPPDYRHHLAYQWQARFFPRLVDRIPELRTELLTARVFLGPRSVRSAAALTGLGLATRHRAGLALAYPYLADLYRGVAGARDRRAALAITARRVFADAVREAGLVAGSVRYRSLVL